MKKKQPQILRGEREAEEMKAPLGDIEEDGRVAVDLYPRQREVEKNQDRRRPLPRARESAVRIRRKEKRA